LIFFVGNSLAEVGQRAQYSGDAKKKRNPWVALWSSTPEEEGGGEPRITTRSDRTEGGSLATSRFTQTGKALVSFWLKALSQRENRGASNICASHNKCFYSHKSIDLCWLIFIKNMVLNIVTKVTTADFVCHKKV
jgi:hypothetical protein